MTSTIAEPRTQHLAGRQLGQRALLAIVLLLYIFVLVRTAWLSDDAYITFRTIDNFVHGYGLTWNTFERVQAYTHPLWMFLLAGMYWLTREIYFTSLAVSMLMSLAAVAVYAAKVAHSLPQAIVGVAILVFSKAFVDYSTSGLENPLTYLLLAVFFGVYLQDKGMTGRRLLALSLVASLAMVNRMDTVLLVAPALLHAWWFKEIATLIDSTHQTQAKGNTNPLASRRRSVTAGVWAAGGEAGPVVVYGADRGGRLEPTGSAGPKAPARRPARLAVLALGMLPFVAWEAFSVIYYGFAFPNTAYAKLNTGIASADLAGQGLYYLLNSLAMDPLTLITIVSAIVTAFALRRGKQAMAAAGIVLYLAYIIRIGGDFMTGRFLAAPLFCAVIILGSIRWQPSRGRLASALAAVTGLGFCPPTATVLSGYDFGPEQHMRAASPHEVSDERATCYPSTGLLRVGQFAHRPDHRWVREAIDVRRSGQKVAIYGGIGFRGYFVGPEVRIIDFLALADPLLARLPAESNPDWRIGHFRRTIPHGYVKTVESGQNQIQDAGLAAFYDKLAVITQGPLFARQRWEAIWEMHRGRYDHLIDKEAYRFPGQVHVDLGQLARLSQRSANTRQPVSKRAAPTSRPEMVRFPRSGIVVHLGKGTRSPSVTLTLTNNSNYEVTWLQGKQELGKASTRWPKNGDGGLMAFRLIAPDAAISQGYDNLRIQPSGRAKECGLSEVRLNDSGL